MVSGVVDNNDKYVSFGNAYLDSESASTLLTVIIMRLTVMAAATSGIMSAMVSTIAARNFLNQKLADVSLKSRALWQGSLVKAAVENHLKRRDI